jgi:pilus assembly protein CpaF
MPWQINIKRGDEVLPPVVLTKGEYRIGRSRSSEILLEHISVSSTHAYLNCQDDVVTIEDRGSTNGTFIEETRLTRPIKLSPGVFVKLGEYQIWLERVRTSNGHDGTSSLKATEAVTDARREVTRTFELDSPQGEPPPVPEHHRAIYEHKPSIPHQLDIPVDKPFSDAQLKKREQYRAIRQEIHQELFKRLDLKRMMMGAVKDEELSEKARKTIDEIIESKSEKIPKGISKGQIANDVFDEAMGLGPLEPFLADPDVTEIMVNGPNSIYVEKKGKLTLSESQFLDDQQLLGIIERIVAPIGRRIDESQPMVDARLKDGSRVNAIIPPLSLKGPCVTIRKFAKIPYKVGDLINFGSMTAEMAEFFRISVKLRKNILISGGTGSGKTTLLNVMSSFLPGTDRIVTIEDAAELRLNQHHVISLEARPPNIEGRGAVNIRDLVRNSLRMRPDRIVVGECRGGEALDMLQAMNTGHDGSLTTAHANSPRDALARMETMVLMAGMELPVRAIREQVASAIQLIVQQDRFSDGTRKITSVTEIVGMENDIITMQELFKYVQTGIDDKANCIGYFTATGCVPTFMEEIKIRGLSLDPQIFNRSDQEGLR